ncbi:MAG: hypothetical protein ACI808_001252 [Paraglaciecola sp.]|jgi:hypothetical protein
MKTALLTSLVLCLTACNSTLDARPITLTESKKLEPAMSEKQLASSIIEFRGTVKYISIEGGFYAIYADDGRRFMPRKLGEIHRRHGLVVKVSGKILKDVITTQQHGQVLEIRSIEIIDDSNVGREDSRF